MLNIYTNTYEVVVAETRAEALAIAKAHRASPLGEVIVEPDLFYRALFTELPWRAAFITFFCLMFGRKGFVTNCNTSTP